MNMQTLTVSATKARNDFFGLLELVSRGRQIVIEKDKKEIAILASRKTKTNWNGLIRAMNASHGIFKNYNPKDNPLRRPGAESFLGRWDK